VVVLGKVLEVRWELLDLHPERRHAEAGPRAAEAAAVRRVEVLYPLDRHIRHLVLLVVGPFDLETNGAPVNRQANRHSARRDERRSRGGGDFGRQVGGFTPGRQTSVSSRLNSPLASSFVSPNRRLTGSLLERAGEDNQRRRSRRPRLGQLRKGVGFPAAGPTSHRCTAAPHGGAIDRSAYDEETECREERQEVTAPAQSLGDYVTAHNPDSRSQS
jgi:hypothetical protein